MNQRLSRLRAYMSEQGLDALVVGQPENRRYLSGFTGSSGLLVITAKQARLITDFRYYEQVRQQAPSWELVEAPTSMTATLAAQLADLASRRVGFESREVTVSTFDDWRQAAPAVEWVPTAGLVEQLRQTKDADELRALEAAIAIADAAVEHIQAWIRPGVTEREVAWELEVYMRTHGGERLAFPIIVAAGTRGAMAHAVPTDQPLQVGDPIVIDMGTVVDGYCSDITRSFSLGRADDAYRRAWDVVLEAQLAAEAAIRPGMTGREADAVARDIIYTAGYEGQFGHGLGHGVGLAVHEAPRASFTSSDVLREGMVISVEPGVYDPAWGGIRTEDLVVLTADGCRVLTQAPKQPVIGG